MRERDEVAGEEGRQEHPHDVHEDHPMRLGMRKPAGDDGERGCAHQEGPDAEGDHARDHRGDEARLRDDFNVFGIRSSDIGMIRRKSEMKERFRAAGVPVAAGRVVDSLEAARELIGETGYPVVAKPNAGVGALDTFRIDSDAPLDGGRGAPITFGPWQAHLRTTSR